jgi:hypothetical protein
MGIRWLWTRERYGLNRGRSSCAVLRVASGRYVPTRRWELPLGRDDHPHRT